MRTVGEWDFDLDLGELRRGIEVVRLTPRSLQVLQYLVDHPGVLVSADSLLSEFWRGAISSDNAVAKAITEIRRALGDDPKSPSYIKTLPRRGYTLVAPVTRRDGKDANVATSDDAEPGRLQPQDTDIPYSPPPDPQPVLPASTSTVSDTRKSVAVLPFENRSSDPENEYFSDGISEELINALVRLPQHTLEAGIACDVIKVGYRKFPIGSHVVFYRALSDTEIEIVRILHKRVDLGRQLEGT